MNDNIANFVMAFIYKYFFEDGVFDGELYFVEHESDSLHFNLYVNDYYFALDDIYTALWYDIPWETLEQRYYLSTDPENTDKINLKNFYLNSIQEWND